MQAFSIIAAILFWTALVQCQKVKFKDCGSQVGKIEELDVIPCSQLPCILKKGNSYTINVTFTITETTDQSFAKVYGIIDGLKVPFPIEYSDACEGGHSGLVCPLKSGARLTYTATLPVKSIYPDIKVLVQWLLTDKADGGGNKIFCGEIFVQITD